MSLYLLLIKASQSGVITTPINHYSIPSSSLLFLSFLLLFCHRFICFDNCLCGFYLPPFYWIRNLSFSSLLSYLCPIASYLLSQPSLLNSLFFHVIPIFSLDLDFRSDPILSFIRQHHFFSFLIPISLIYLSTISLVPYVFSLKFLLQFSLSLPNHI